MAPPTNVLMDIYNVDGLGNCGYPVGQTVNAPGNAPTFGQYYDSGDGFVIYYPLSYVYDSPLVYYSFTGGSYSCPP